MAASSLDSEQQVKYNAAKSSSEESANEEIYDPFLAGEVSNEFISEGTPFDTIVNICPQPPHRKDMGQIRNKSCIFMISPFKYDPLHPEREPTSIYTQNRYDDRWDADHVRMPCSPSNVTRDRQSIWVLIRQSLIYLKTMCDNSTATVEDLKTTIENCVRRRYDMVSLEKLINEHYSDDERGYFMSTVLSNICYLALNVDKICSRSPPLLRVGSNQSVTMSQQQAASLLACAFFCLFPFRSDRKDKNRFGKFPKLNFNRLYRSGQPKKIETLKCILHYFRRITEKMPTGVITIQRFALDENLFPRWHESTTGLCDLHLTTGKKIEEVNNTLQVDFANKYIGGGVLGSGCVQEEIRFSICPEMLVSLLVCEMMETNECVFLIGCERYSSYKGYAASFKFAGNYDDDTPKDNWGRKWCHLVAMDAIFFRDRSVQYHIKNVDRELLKAYTSFRPLGNGPDYEFGVATGNWGCGAFNGDRQLKAIIQLMAASEARRPLIYAAYGDKNLVTSFYDVYNYLKKQGATVADLYYYLQRFSDRHNQSSLFDYILGNPVSSLRSKL